MVGYAAVPATLDEILSQVAARLISKVSDFTENNVLIADTATPESTPETPLTITVTVSDGSFDDQNFAGGGVDSVTMDAHIEVTLLARVGDQGGGRSDGALLSDPKGLLVRYVPRILKALLLEIDETTQARGPWFPRNKAGAFIVRDQLHPRGFLAPRKAAEDQTLRMMQLTFGVSFDWKL